MELDNFGSVIVLQSPSKPILWDGDNILSPVRYSERIQNSLRHYSSESSGGDMAFLGNSSQLVVRFISVLGINTLILGIIA